MLIENGVARNVVYDSYTAGREAGKKSTGHALPPSARIGPVPLNLFVKPGEASLEEMISSTERGLLVTRFHYVNPVHPVLTIITGMTRDGTYLIEDGEIKRPVKNLRFTQGILPAFAEIAALGVEPKLCDMFGFGGVSVPAMRIKRFSFTGTTEF